jgi:hypothetical protein
LALLAGGELQLDPTLALLAGDELHLDPTWALLADSELPLDSRVDVARFARLHRALAFIKQHPSGAFLINRVAARLRSGRAVGRYLVASLRPYH